MADTIIEIENLRNVLGGKVVHEDVNLRIERREIIAIIGGSGSGKTTLLRSILTLLTPSGGSIKVFDKDVLRCSLNDLMAVKHRWGVMFQQSALFSSLNVLDNVCFPLREFTKLPAQMRNEIAFLKIALAGLEIEAAFKFPSELSGGMKKRAALARAIALDPELLFLDEPGSGLDPKSAKALDELILHLRDSLGLTVVIITHDYNSLWRIADRVVFLGEGRVLAAEPIAKLVNNPHPLIQDYFAGIKTQE